MQNMIKLFVTNSLHWLLLWEVNMMTMPTWVESSVDMEIDMVGGTVIGRIDVAVSKESSSRFCVESNKETVDEDALKSNILYSFKDLDSTVEHAISKPEQAHHLVA